MISVSVFIGMGLDLRRYFFLHSHYHCRAHTYGPTTNGRNRRKKEKEKRTRKKEEDLCTCRISFHLAFPRRLIVDKMVFIFSRSVHGFSCSMSNKYLSVFVSPQQTVDNTPSPKTLHLGILVVFLYLVCRTPLYFWPGVGVSRIRKGTPFLFPTGRSEGCELQVQLLLTPGSPSTYG